MAEMTEVIEHGVNPFVGPRAFTAADRDLFFGRGAELRRLRALVVARKAVLLFAPSGAGKTSLLQAGLLPLLPREVPGLAVFPVVRLGGGADGEGPNRYARRLLSFLPGGPAAEGNELGTDLEAGLNRAFGILVAERSGGDPVEACLLVIDQLEEIFAAGLEGEAERRDFLVELARSIQRAPQISLLLAIREDFLAGLDPYLDLFPDRLRARYRLEMLAAQAAVRAIRGPAERAGVEVEESVARRLVDNLRRCPVPGPGGMAREGMDDHVDPVQLQVVCRQFWESLPAGVTRVEAEHVTAFGTVDAVLAGYYAERVAAVVAATGVAERAIREWIGRRLITPEGLRCQTMKETGRRGLGEEAISGLIEARLVHEEMRRGLVWYELAHDRLIGPVRDDNEAWRKRRRGRLRRIVGTGAILLGCVALISAVLAGRLLSFSIDRPVSALALGLSGERTGFGYRDGSVRLVATSKSWRRALRPRTFERVCRREVASLVLLADGGWVAGCGEGTIRIHRESAQAEPQDLDLAGDGSAVSRLAVTPRGDLLAGGTEGGSVWLWNLILGRRVAGPLKAHEDGIVALAFRAGGRELVSVGADGSIVATAVNVEPFAPLANPRSP